MFETIVALLALLVLAVKFVVFVYCWKELKK